MLAMRVTARIIAGIGTEMNPRPRFDSWLGSVVCSRSARFFTGLKSSDVQYTDEISTTQTLAIPRVTQAVTLYQNLLAPRGKFGVASAQCCGKNPADSPQI